MQQYGSFVERPQRSAAKRDTTLTAQRAVFGIFSKLLARASELMGFSSRFLQTQWA